MLRRAGDIELRGYAGVNRQHVVRHGRAVAAQDGPPFQVESHGLGVKQPRPGEAGERPKVDVGVVEGVVACDQPGQHARVGRVQVAGDDGDPHAGNGTHAEPAEHDDVAVATPDEDEILEDGGTGGHRGRSGAVAWLDARPASARIHHRLARLLCRCSKAPSLCRWIGKVKPVPNR